MKRALILVVLLVAALAFTAPAQAATPSNRALARQIKTLQAQVKALQKSVREARLIALGGLAYSGCVAAVTADTFQGTWATIDDVSNRATAPRVIFGPQTPVNDFALCNAYEIRRAPTTVPPNVSIFSALLNIFQA